MFEKVFENVKRLSPLVHCITNYVTVNDCANIILASGASPVMSDFDEDCVDITAISNALLLNIGTINAITFDSMKKSATKANEKGIPVVLDPVGAGATKYRTSSCLELIRDYKISLLRGNISEIKAIAGVSANTKGVDASSEDEINDANLDKVISFAADYALKTGIIVSISGKIDIITDGNVAFLVHNGNKKMSTITGTGCQLSALSAAFLAANRDNMLKGAACAVAVMGVCGDIALKKHPECGNSSYRNYIIDEVSNLTRETLCSLMRVDMKVL